MGQKWSHHFRLYRYTKIATNVSAIPCRVIELPVWRVISKTNLANNGEVLAGVLF
jgi:hypothetical protein